MTDVSPEIKKLYDLAFDVKEEGWESCSATSCVSVADAEAAVLACEQRMATHAAEVLHRERERTIAAVTTMVREGTVAEIVEALRLKTAESAFAEGDYAEGQEVGWIDAADYVESRTVEEVEAARAALAAATPDPPAGPIPGPDPGACPRCGEWRKAGMIHRCPAATPDPPREEWRVVDGDNVVCRLAGHRDFGTFRPWAEEQCRGLVERFPGESFRIERRVGDEEWEAWCPPDTPMGSCVPRCGDARCEVAAGRAAATPDPPEEPWSCCGQTFTGTADFISGARSAHVCDIAPEDVPDAETAYAMGKAAATPPAEGSVSYRVRDRDSDYKAMCHEDRDHAELLLKAWLADGRDAVVERRHVFDGGWLPVGRPFFTGQQERMLDRCEAFDAANPDPETDT